MSVKDAETFLEAAKHQDIPELERRDAEKWLFRVKNQLSERYTLEVEGFETSYEAVLKSKTGDTEFVVDRQRDRAEVNAFVVEDGEVKVNEVHRQP